MRSMTAMTKLHRLYNVQSASIDFGGGAAMTMRPDTIEIATVDDRTVLTMYVLYPDDASPLIEADPRLIGRVSLQGAVDIVDAVSGDGRQWSIEHPTISVHVLPPEDETILVDAGFGRDLPRNLAAMYGERARVTWSLIMAERMSNAVKTAPDAGIYQSVAERLREHLTALDKRIRDLDPSDEN